MKTVSVSYIFERYPVLTQTFLRREIAALSHSGLRIEIHSMLGGANTNSISTGKLPECIPVYRFRWWQALKLIIALPRECLRDPALLRDGWRLWRKHPFNNWENFWATLWAVIFALCEAQKFRKLKPDILHGVRATGPTTAAAILSRLCGIPFSFGGHAYDIYRHGGDAFLEPKLQAARFVHTTTIAAEDYLRRKTGDSAVKIVLARRGLENLPPKIERDITNRPIALLSIGRLVSKKGHIHQIAACALLKSWNVPFAARIIGDGPLRGELQKKINQARLCDCITLVGACSPEQTNEVYRWADIFLHTGVVDSEGDRDGLPNVIPEAFAHSLPVIANNLPGTAEAVLNGINGLVVDATNPEQLAKAVKKLAENPALRKKFGDNGCRWVEENFLALRNAEMLARAFGAQG